MQLAAPGASPKSQICARTCALNTLRRRASKFLHGAALLEKTVAPALDFAVAA